MQFHDDFTKFGASEEDFMATFMAIEDYLRAAWAADVGHPAARFAADCTLQVDICKSLLAVADSLPGPFDATTIEVLSKLLQPTWNSHVAFQSQVLVPLIERRHESLADLSHRVAPLSRQHIEISGINDEVAEYFDMIACGEEVEAEMFGYLIRNAAERRREHVDWEMVLLGPLLPHILTPAERHMFSDWAAANPWPFDGFKDLAIPNAN